MLAEVGRYALIAASILCLYSMIASVLGARFRRADLVESGERAIVGLLFLVVFASSILIHALATSNFQFEYVTNYTSTTLPLPYKLTAFWGGQAGSMLFWLLILVVYTTVALLQNQNKNRQLMPYVTTSLAGTCLFFLIMLLFAADPFKKLSPVPVEGQSLNPLLQNYWMVSHPPSLYIGYVGLTVPFAFAMAALITAKLDSGWIRAIRKWTLFSWLFLTVGILQGSYWAYIELGWGGYWAWDPVENASLMPWLAATAFLHSVMIQEKKGMLKMWNMVLVLVSFSLSIFGTFLTRSGVVSSVHSFAQSPIGSYFIAFMVIQIGVSVFFLLKRKKALEPEARLESFVSRESSFLLNNVFFLVICIAVLCGTVFPILSEAVTGSKVTVSAPFFNKVVMPFAIGLVLLTGICPLIAWRKASVKNLKRNFLLPGIIALSGSIVLALFGVHHWLTLLFFFCSMFVLVTVYTEFNKGTKARMAMVNEAAPAALYHLVERNKRRYGGFIIHTGVALLFTGIAASSFYQLEKEVTVSTNDSFAIGAYTLKFRELQFLKDPHKEVWRARLEVYKGEKQVGLLHPERHFYKNSDQPTTEVAIRPFWNEDLYMILVGPTESGAGIFKVYVNPFIGLIWRGGIIIALGSLIVLLPDMKTKFAVSTVRDTGAEEFAG
ncbi:heme lyase CcmF/NrfE family subunit [bacterium]|nr:heme lyase CcmF/NrfE family subunit [bacterium]